MRGADPWLSSRVRQVSYCPGESESKELVNQQQVFVAPACLPARRIVAGRVPPPLVLLSLPESCCLTGVAGPAVQTLSREAVSAEHTCCAPPSRPSWPWAAAAAGGFPTHSPRLGSGAGGTPALAFRCSLVCNLAAHTRPQQGATTTNPAPPQNNPTLPSEPSGPPQGTHAGPPAQAHAVLQNTPCLVQHPPIEGSRRVREGPAPAARRAAPPRCCCWVSSHAVRRDHLAGEARWRWRQRCWARVGGWQAWLGCIVEQAAR